MTDDPFEDIEPLADQQRHEDAEERRANDEAAALAYVLDSPHGRAFIWGLLEQAKVFSSTFNPNPSTAAFEEGKRALGLTVLRACIWAHPVAFAQMQAEHAARLATYNLTEGN